MKRLAYLVAPSLCLLAVAAIACGDIVHLNDGTSIEGVVKRNGDGWDVTQPNGKTTHITVDMVRQIELGTKNGGPDAAESKLNSLRRSVENISDIKTIRERYEKFIEHNKGTPAAADALKDLAIWQDRMDRQMIKLGPNWVTAEEKQRILEKNFIATDGVRQLIKAGRFNEADPIITQLLTDDPTNAGALYLRGLLLFKQDQLPAARRAFESARDALPAYGPTLNNLAIIFWRQNQIVGAMSTYDAALLSPGRFQVAILNNVAEALNAVPPELHNNPMVVRVTKLFTDQDAAVQQQMMQAGYFRWGSTWVDRTQLEQLKAAEADNQKKLTEMQADYDSEVARIGRIDDEMADIERAMARIEKTSVTRDSSGNLVRLPLPSAYYDYDHDHHKLQAEEKERLAKLDAMRAAARAIQQQLPVPKYTGLQQVIGIEGAPMPDVATNHGTPQQATTAPALESAPATPPPAPSPSVPSSPSAPTTPSVSPFVPPASSLRQPAPANPGATPSVNPTTTQPIPPMITPPPHGA